MMRSVESETCFFGHSTRDKLRMRFTSVSSLTSRQMEVVFTKLKEEITHILSENNLHAEFQFRLLMCCPDPNSFLNVMLGWLDGKPENKKVMDECVRVFHLLFPEVYHFVKNQERLYKRSLLKGENKSEQDHLFAELKEDITVEVQKHKLQDDFCFKLMMTAPDAAIFLNIMVGWLGSLQEKKTLYANCIHIFRESHPMVYQSVNDQAPIPTLA